jgi:hypothetical protein
LKNFKTWEKVHGFAPLEVSGKLWVVWNDQELFPIQVFFAYPKMI